MNTQPTLFDLPDPPVRGGRSFPDELRAFVYQDKPTDVSATISTGGDGSPLAVPTFVNEFWTSRQRAAHSLHEVSYRACFKPQLPRFFIERLTKPGDRVYDPFMGRGHDAGRSRAARSPRGADATSTRSAGRCVRPRLEPPALVDIESRLTSTRAHAARRRATRICWPSIIPTRWRAICALRTYLLERESSGTLDAVDRWIRMVAVNRLTGHSPGFFSVYTLPPNQAVSVEVQQKINAKRGQSPPPRDVKRIILKKSASLLGDCDARDGPKTRPARGRTRCW